MEQSRERTQSEKYHQNAYIVWMSFLALYFFFHWFKKKCIVVLFHYFNFVYTHQWTFCLWDWFLWSSIYNVSLCLIIFKWIIINLTLYKNILICSLYTSCSKTFIWFIIAQRYCGCNVRLRTLAGLEFHPIQVQLAENWFSIVMRCWHACAV